MSRRVIYSFFLCFFFFTFFALYFLFYLLLLPSFSSCQVLLCISDIMDIKVESKRLEDKIADLKVELKTWEHSFEATNGKPPSRQDIKGSKEICVYLTSLELG